MIKSRIEALSDGIFAIVFTLLVIEIKVPEHLSEHTNSALWHEFTELSPLFFGYLVSFVVLTMFWNSHSYLFNVFIKNTDRIVNYLNLLFLFFIALVPFSAHLIGEYRDLNLSVIIYGFHVLLISIISNIIFYYILNSKEIDTSHNSSRLLKQGTIRQSVTLIFTLFGIMFAFLDYTNVAFAFYMFPIIFNIIPGSLNFIEKILRIELK